MDNRVGFLSYSGFIIPTHTLKVILGKYYDNFLKKLTLTYTPKIGPAVKANLWGETSIGNCKCITLPRTSILLMNKILTIKLIYPPLCRINPYVVDIYQNQQLIVNHIVENIFTENRIANGTSTALLNLRAGMGKTFVAAGIIGKIALRTIYVVPKRPLMLQAVKDLRMCMPDHKIASYDSKMTTLPDILVIVINSALEKAAELAKNYSFAIFDEVHSYCSEKRRKVFRLYSAPVCLGMSATTEDRIDGFDPIAHKELAYPSDSLEGESDEDDKNNKATIKLPKTGIIRAEDIPGFTYDAVVFDCRARIINYYGPPEHTQNLTHESTGKIFCSYMYKQYLADPYRLKLVTQELIKLYDWVGPNNQKHNIYIFAEEIALLRISMEALRRELLLRARADIIADLDVPELGLEMFTGGLKDNQVSEISLRGRVLCSTYGFSGTGISIPKMTCILFLTPRKSQMKQICARVIRRNSDMSIPRFVVDIVDARTSLRYQVNKRMEAYEYYGFKIENVKIKYTDIEL